ncbi:AfsR/SARP family transcriptional regulator [Actinophytocola sp.]|uniref:AfsR/SARP family transcriptional regulator n=1 Tax=Actinophytocola sp. TaxID=1872138 RepID=UPI002ED13ED6
MRFRVLGPVEVRHEDRLISLGSGRRRFVLALLLLNADRLTPLSQLVDALWEIPPPTAKAQLHNVISDLRRRLGEPDLIVTHAAGYELRLGSHDLDLSTFRRLVEQAQRVASDGDHPRAAILLARARDLWRGPALADAAGDSVPAVRQALHEERLAATEAGFDATMMSGRYDDVLREVDELIAEYPYRERLHEIKMMALACAGRRADALAVYREVYQRLTEDLGVEPGRSLRQLHERILRGESTAPTRVTVLPKPQQLPAGPIVFAGRDKLLTDICAALQVTALAVLVGPGGVGKTTLALAAAHRFAESFPDGQLYADLRGSHSAAVDPHTAIGRLLRTLGVTSVPDDREERIALYRSHLAERRMLLVLDDAAGEEQVRPLLPGTATCAVLVTSRRQLAGLVGATRWTVPVLSGDDAVRLLAALVGTERAGHEPEAAVAITDLCGRLPLAVCVAAGRLSARTEWTLEEFRQRLAEERGRLDELTVGDLDVRASIALSYQALEPPLRGLFRLLGLVSAPDWPIWVAERLFGGEPVARMLDQLVDTHLIEPLGLDVAGQPRFRLHDLIADFARERALAEDEPAARDAALTGLLTDWLSLAGMADERLGHGMLYADGLDGPPAPPRTPAAVRENPAAWFDAERVSLAHAVDEARRLGEAGLAGRLALRLSGYLSMRSYDDDREHTLRGALASVRGHDLDDVLMRLLGALFAARAQRDQYAELPALAEEELAVARRLGDRRGEFQALTHAGRAARMLGRYDEAANWLAQALAAARGSGAPPQLVSRALYAFATLQADRGRSSAALPLLEEAVAIAREEGSARLTAMQLHSHGLRLMEVGRLAEAEQALAEALATTRDIGDDRGTAWLQQALADVDLRSARWPAAADRLDRSLAAMRRVADQEGIAEVLRSLGDLAVGQGRPADAIEALRESLAIWRQLGARLEQARTLLRLDLVLHAVGDADEAAACRREGRRVLTELDLDESSLRFPPFLTQRS